MVTALLPGPLHLINTRQQRTRTPSKTKIQKDQHCASTP